MFLGELCITKHDFLVLMFLTHFNGLLPPLPEVQCAIFFWIFEILGGKEWKEVVSDLKTFSHKGCEIGAAKEICLRFFISFVHSD